MKKQIIGAVVLAVGSAAALAAAAIPAGSVTASAEPVAGIIRQAEAYATADPVAEKGMQEAVRRCMAAAGYDYTPPLSTLAIDLNKDIGYPRLTVEAAKASGYTSTQPRGPGEAAPGSAEGRLFADPAFEAALAGTPTQVTKVGDTGALSGGCRGEAMTRIYGSPENYMLATGMAYNPLLAATRSASRDAGIASAVKAWTDCMKETPYPSFATPARAVEAGRAAGGQEEFRIAVTDAVCRDQTGFHKALDAVLDKYLTTRMQELAPQIERVKEIRRAAAANAAALGSASSN